MNELTTEIIAALAKSKIWTKFFVTPSLQFKCNTLTTRP